MYQVLLNYFMEAIRSRFIILKLKRQPLVRSRDSRLVGKRPLLEKARLIDGIGFIYQAYSPEYWYNDNSCISFTDL